MVAGQQALAAVATRPRATLLRASLVLLAVAAASKLSTLAADSYVAARFGLSADTDAYLLAIGLMSALLAAPSETLRLSVLPICGRYLRHGELRSAAGVVALLLLTLVALGSAAAIILVICLPWVARFVAPGFEGEAVRTLVQLGRVLSIALVLGLVMAVLLGALHAQLRFGAPAVVGIGFSVGVVGGGILLGRALGIVSLAVGYVAGMAGVTAILAWLSRGLYREGVAFREARHQAAPFLRLALPTGLAISVVSFGAVIERAVASATGSGNVAALGFTIKLITVAGVVSQSVWTPLTPMLTASGATSEEQGDARLVPFSLKLVLLILVPATALLIALREPLVSVIFQRGAFTAADTSRTATLLALHSGSLVGEGLFMVAVAALLSFHDSGTRLVGSGLLIVSKVAMMAALAPVFGVAGIALAASASSLLAGAYAVRVLGRRFPSSEMRSLVAFGGRVILAALLALLVASSMSELTGTVSEGATLTTGVARLGIGGLGAVTAYVGALKLLRVDEVETLWRQVQARWSRSWS